MNYLLVEQLSKSFGEKELFSNITFGLEKGQKAGLIARNGTGKSTLLEIIAGETWPDTGQVVVRKGINMMYLPQDPLLDPNTPVLDAVLAADSEPARLVRAYERLISVPDTLWNSVQKQSFNEINERLTAIDGWQFEARVKEVLGKLEIQRFDQRCGELSGGQKKKVALARILIEDADLLILDEPTNHLDIDTIEWMEEFLSRSQLTLLLVTHDRYFLDQVCDSIVELEQGRLFQYKGDYAYYLEKKCEREAAESVVKEKQKARYLKELDWIRRMPKARTHKSKSRITEFGALADEVKQHRQEEVKPFFVKMERLGGKIMEINNVHKSFGDLKIIDDFSYTFKKGDKVGLVGKNGAGKTTFLEMIMGQLPPDMGRIVTGKTLKLAYFTQQGLELDKDRRVIDIVKDVAEEVYISEKHTVSASRFLSMFGIAHEIQYNYAIHLSGGEQRKLHLLMTLMQQPNFLILDEPTNDLDIVTLQALEEFLEDFPGCLMVASHDRFFLDRIAGHLFVWTGDGKVKDFYGNYTAYRKKRDTEKRAHSLAKGKELKVEPTKPKQIDPTKPTWKEQREFEVLGKEIELLEVRKRELECLLGSGSGDHIELQQWSEEIGELIARIDEKTERWMELAEKIT
jgi:ABC transport system ATP-binding/permease protein